MFIAPRPFYDLLFRVTYKCLGNKSYFEFVPVERLIVGVINMQFQEAMAARVVDYRKQGTQAAILRAP